MSTPTVSATPLTSAPAHAGPHVHAPAARAFAATDPTAALAAVTIPRRAVGVSDVEIQILYCGVCHSDLHQARNEWQNTTYPCVPGHEIVGRVTNVGANVTRFKAGDLAGVGCLVGSCGVCDSCRDGLEQVLRSGADLHLQQPGPAHGPDDLRRLLRAHRRRRSVHAADPTPRSVWRPSLRCSALGSRPTRRCATGMSAGARRSALSVSAVSATWA